MDELEESRLVLRHYVLAPLLVALAIGVAFSAHKVRTKDADIDAVTADTGL